MRIIRQSSFAAVPWKNGGGVTHEAIRVPPHGVSFDWRVSVAHIDTAGPFSYFADYNRFMVLLKGAGVVLKFSGGATPGVRELRGVGDMQEFDGALATTCELVNGPCVDLNFMVSKNLHGVRARVELLREARSFEIGSHESMLVFPIDAGVALAHGESTDRLDPWDLAVLSGWEASEARIVGAGRGEGVCAVKLFVASLPQEDWKDSMRHN
jgi:environmental stress-induced protein Ves